MMTPGALLREGEGLVCFASLDRGPGGRTSEDEKVRSRVIEIELLFVACCFLLLYQLALTCSNIVQRISSQSYPVISSSHTTTISCRHPRSLWAGRGLRAGLLTEFSPVQSCGVLGCIGPAVPAKNVKRKSRTAPSVSTEDDSLRTPCDRLLRAKSSRFRSSVSFPESPASFFSAASSDSPKTC